MMLQITPDTLALLRSAQEAANAKLRSQRTPVVKLQSLQKRRFEELVDDVMRILKQGQPTYFAFEGACRHGVRSSLCLDGWKWNDADQVSAKVITTALGHIGAVRPSWWQGQPEYSETNSLLGICNNPGCGKPIPTDRGLRNGKQPKYCSDECGRWVMATRTRIDQSRVAKAEYLARCAARSAETLRRRSRNCANPECQKFFVTREASRKYCSQECSTAVMTKWQDRICANPNCNKVFSPKNGGPEKGVTKYCSKQCAAICRRKVRPALTCQNPACNGIFYPNYPSDKRSYCSPECGVEVRKAKRNIDQTPPLAPNQIEPLEPRSSAFRCEEA